MAAKARERRPSTALARGRFGVVGRETRSRSTEGLPATFTARLVALDERGQAWIGWGGSPKPPDGTPCEPPEPSQRSPARSTLALHPELLGREVLVCRANEAGEPVIVGVLTEGVASSKPPEPAAAPATPEPMEPPAAPPIEVLVDRQRLLLEARAEVVLRCGDASITLSADGKVTIRGVDVVSSAERTQRIRGGAVRIN